MGFGSFMSKLFGEQKKASDPVTPAKPAESAPAKSAASAPAAPASDNPWAWQVQAFTNLVKLGKIQTDGMGYYMDGGRMDGITLYDVFISSRRHMTREMASLSVSSPSFSAMAIRSRIPADAQDSGSFGMYESMYEVKRMEFYQLFLQYFG